MPRRGHKNIFKVSIVLVLLLTMGAVGYFSWKNQRYQKQPVPPAISFSSIVTNKQPSPNVAKPGETQTAPPEAVIPPELNLQVPFYSQAPYENWGEPWQEACEEASILLVANVYYNHNWTKAEFNQQILDLVAWEEKQFGHYKDTPVKEIVEMLDGYLGLKSIVHENPTFEDVQKVLASGHLIVMTFDGKTLGNPYYHNGGPIYHAMVIKGYKAGQKIISNDVGTKNGENYVYDWATIENSLHDYTTPITDGAKRMIEILPPTL